MADAQTLTMRLARFRAMMEERGYDAALIRNNADLRWLTGAERLFDFETAHTAFITADDLFIHTDSRYFNTFLERLGKDSIWKIDQDDIAHPAWAAEMARKARARTLAVEDSSTLAFFDELKTELAKASIAPATPRMHEDIATLRIEKDEEELKLMAHAQSITDAAFTHICDFIKPGMTEQKIRVELENFMFENGADALSFDSIIAAGPNGANPHAKPGETVVREGDMLVMDYGAGYLDYNSDMTRTVCVGAPSKKQREVYDIVRLAHETCAEKAECGCIGKDIHNLAVQIISDAGYGEFFGHGLGHGVGIDIHEKPYFNKHYAGTIPEGAVITIEPGIYLPGEFGVRLEDFGVMTKDGYKPFTSSTHELVVVGE